MPQPSSPRSSTTLQRHLASETDTLRLGAQLARALRPGLMVYLSGDLGAGKTTLVRGLLREMGWSGPVKSPTYALVEIYSLFNFDLYHFDLYRFNNALEWEDSGFGEYCHSGSVCLVEWPEKAAGVLPDADLRIDLQPRDDTRDAQILALTARGEACLHELPDF
ncbi:MAG: tRNA (adenosine(37)-N6)-threonylcarbamoyltransferase complex ATPase subunit type 1 TsaE [Betaproteobacteria bacterium]|nr:tRNA (adenosine(37)-N6)-threonylcarbamoyltransferase complex ATPase subunit type 1 TsaE [Betaproteobacteria bacterium]